MFQGRSDLLSFVKGDTIQILKTKEYLEKIGADVSVSTELNPDLEGYGLVHLFNMNCDTYFQCLNAKKQGKVVALSPLYWPQDELLARGYGGAGILLKNDRLRNWLAYCRDRLSGRTLGESLLYQRKVGLRRLQERILELSDFLLPNAEVEMDELYKNFRGIEDKPYKNIPNGVDPEFKDAKPDFFVSKYGLEDFVLCVGAISPRKNQLSVITALSDTDLKTVFIGKPDFQNRGYYKKCRKLANENFLFIDEFPHERISSAYSAARVHVLPSWLETPGLVNLEAGLAGCNLVMGDRGSVREYFKDFAGYCNPGDVGDIREAVLDAQGKPKNEKLGEHILKNYTWDKTAKRTLEVYLSLGL